MSKNTVSFITVLALLVSCCSGVYAGVTPDSQYLISDLGSGLSKSSSGNLLILGDTFSFVLVDEISVTVYLQRWDGSTWVDIGSPTTSKEFNSRRAITASERIVQQNSFYRTRSIHEAKLGGATEIKYLFSSAYYYQ